MEYILESEWDNLEGTDRLYKDLDELVSWKSTPPFHSAGRTGWQKLDRPLRVSGPRVFTSVKSLKLKGIGYCNEKFEVIPPTQKYFTRNFPHLGFSKNGRFCMVESDQAPLGGIEFGRAKMEYDIAKKLTENGCPSVIPIRLYKYNQSFITSKYDSNLAVVVTGLPVEHPFRADCAYRYESCLAANHPVNELGSPKKLQSAEERAHVERLSKQLKLDTCANVSLALISHFYEKYGQTLRKFHTLGFYRYSGSLDNFDYCAETDVVYLIDLDSSRLLEECSDIEKPLQVIRDISSAFFNLAGALMDPWRISSFPISDVKDTSPFRSILKGYYSDVPDELIDTVITNYSTYYEGLHQQVSVHAREIIGEKDRDKQLAKWKPFWMNRKEVYSMLMANIWFLHEKSSMSKLYPNLLNWERCIENISEFTSQETATKIRDSLTTLVDLL